MLVLDYVQLLMMGQAGQWTQPHPPPLSSQKNEILNFGLHSTSGDWPGWLMRGQRPQYNQCQFQNYRFQRGAYYQNCTQYGTNRKPYFQGSQTNNYRG